MEGAYVSPQAESSTCFTDSVVIPEDSNILSKEVIKSIEMAVEAGKLLNVALVVKEVMQKVSSISVSIAVTGDTGNGMSSFINALRVVGHEQEDSAPTGVVRTTQRPTCYSSSSFPYVELWDLPGLGATAQSVESYLEEVKGSQYDLFIIIASEQFSSNHVQLAKAIQRMGKKFYVVWTKVDRDFNTSALSESQLRQNVQKNILENLQKEGVKGPPVFLVSSLEPSSHDFPKLRKMLQESLSKIRCNGLSETFFQICEKIINSKVHSIKRRIDIGSLPETSGHSMESPTDYPSLFGVDDEPIQQVAQSMNTSVAEYKAIQTCRQDGWTWSWMCHVTTNFFYTTLSYMPYCGDSGTYYLRCKQQEKLVGEVADKTKRILRKILDDSVVCLSQRLQVP
ncbi:immunity-related GTPase family M protein 1-like [Nannospalax galili]|uniref:immunity-related GTPase family M protein 1-like n=1 Tax=Nannospalax galili TaxID=1026970 RepID=UPI0004ED27FE|nr:immunity-related GTPase family M protein 1-like [Nannospalax galili]XP_029423789.1 immunity-related GTPase family M protein 1-like [Nannospalax galili]